MNRLYLFFIVGALLLAGCAGSDVSPLPTGQPTERPRTEPTDRPNYYWSQLLERDAIRPIYEPTFVPAEEAGYSDDEVVMGVVIDGQAKAYPIGLLSSREMVNDELAGTPILVTW